MRYKIVNNVGGAAMSIFDTETFWYIPIDESNRHYQEYLVWLAEGNTPEEWNPNGSN